MVEMGCCYSKADREEMVRRCRGRQRYMKELVKARHAMAASHAMYLRSLRAVGSSLLQFSLSESTLHRHHRPPPPPLSPISCSWTTTTTTTSSIVALPPPPPPPPQTSSWEYWDPFAPPPPASDEEPEWAGHSAAMNAVSDAADTMTERPSVMSNVVSTELAIVPRKGNGKNLNEILKEADDYFLAAADGGASLSSILEVKTITATLKSGEFYHEGCNLTSPPSWLWGWSSPKVNRVSKFNDHFQDCGSENGGNSHRSTVERLYAWEKKLFQEVKDVGNLKIEHEKKVAIVRKLEAKRADLLKCEKMKKEVEKLESEMVVSAKGIESTSSEIIKLRDTELYPQLMDLIKGLTCTWRSMYEAHQVQTHIVQQLKYLDTVPSLEPTSEIHRQATLELELQVQQWHFAFSNLIKAQRDYIESLAGWLRLSLFQFSKSSISRTNEESKIYSLCEEWQHAVDRIPDKVVSEGINNFLTVLHAIVVQQAEEQKQSRRYESIIKEFEKRMCELKNLESKYSSYSTLGASSSDPVAEKRAKVEFLRTKAEEEKTRNEKAVFTTRSMTMNNLQMSLPHLFQAMVGYSRVCMHAFESIYDQQNKGKEEHVQKKILE